MLVCCSTHWLLTGKVPAQRKTRQRSWIIPISQGCDGHRGSRSLWSVSKELWSHLGCKLQPPQCPGRVNPLMHTRTWGYPQRRHRGKSGVHLSHRRSGGEEQGRGRRTEESPREGASALGFIALQLLSFFSHYANMVVIEISSSPRQALLTAQLG